MHHVIVFGLLPPVSQQGNPPRELGLIADDRPALAIGTEVLAGIETETTEIADRSRAAAFVFSAMRLRRVLDDDEVVAAGNLHNRIHISHQAVQVDWQDRPVRELSQPRSRPGFIVHVTGSTSTNTGLAPL